MVTIVDGGRFDRVFGGGNGYSATGNHDKPYFDNVNSECTATPSETACPDYNPGADIGTGGIDLKINGGKIRQLFSGSNQYGTIAGPISTTIDDNNSCEEDIEEYFSGNNAADLTGNVTTRIACSDTPVRIHTIYGGCNEADIYGNVSLTVEGGNFDYVYGGSKGDLATLGGDHTDKLANIKVFDAQHRPEGYPDDSIGGGGRVNLYLKGGTILNAFGGNNLNGNIDGLITVDVTDAKNETCPLILTNLYGASNLATYIPTTATATGDNYAPIIKVNHIREGQSIRGNVYGGGKGTKDNIEKGKCQSNPKINIGDGEKGHYATISGNVYGGGDLAYINGNTTVIINGDNSVVGPETPAANTNRFTLKGCVYGGGHGTSDTLKDEWAKVTGNTTVTVGTTGAPAIHGSLFGGGEDAQVWGSTHVTLTNGTIGSTTLYTGLSSTDFDELNDYVGNVYGGGRGLNRNANGYIPNASGNVRGSTQVDINGGHVCHNVFGGGSLAAVGVDGQPGYKEESTGTTGRATINVTGGLIGTYADPIDNGANASPRYTPNPNAYYGNVFGGGRGRPGSTLDGKINYRYYNYVSNTVVNINYSSVDNSPTGTNHIVGNVYGGGDNGSVNCSTLVNITGGLIGSHGDKGFGSLEGNVYGGGNGEDHFQAYPLGSDGKYLTRSGISSGISKPSQVEAYNSEHSSDPIDAVDSLSRFAGWVFGNTNVVIEGSTADAVQVLHHVYGGGSMATVGKFQSNLNANPPIIPSAVTDGTGHTKVWLKKGTIGTKGHNNGIIFGASRGDDPSAYFLSYLNGSSFVGSTEVIVGDTTSASDLTSAIVNGSVYGGGENGHVFNNTYVRIHAGTIGNPDEISPDLGNVYGGGCGTDTYIENGTEKYVPEAGVVRGNTFINITGGHVTRSVYGAGSMGSVGRYTYDDDGTVFSDASPAANTGTTTVYVTGGTIGRDDMYNPVDPSDPSKPNDLIAAAEWYKSDYGHEPDDPGSSHIFGAGRGVESNAENLICNVKESKVIIGTDATLLPGYPVNSSNDPVIYGSVFGGAANGHVLGSTNVRIHSGTIGTYAISSWDGNIFGGGEGSGKYTLTNDVNDNGEIDDGDDYNYAIYPTCGRVAGNTNVTIDGGRIKGSVYGGGRLALTGVKEDGTYIVDPSDSTKHGLAIVNVSGSPVIGMGSNDNDALDAKISLASDYSVGDIFGSGRGDVLNYIDVLAGRTANTYISVSETPTVYGAVFGGGEMAGVGWWTEASGHPFVEHTGTSRVNIAGGTFGTDYEYTKGYLDNHGDWTVVTDGKLTHACTGNIVGGSQGDVDPECPHWISMGRSRQTYVNISAGTIKGNVYGGAEQGVVIGNTDVRVSGGTIGTRIVNPSSDANKTIFNTAVAKYQSDSITHAGQVAAYVTWVKNGRSGDHPTVGVEPTYPEPGDTAVYLYSFGSVFGGGYGREVTDRHYNDSCIINTITNTGTEQDPVYDTSWTKLTEATLIAGRTYGNTNVLISGGTIRENVYGGGNMASVGYVKEDDENHKYDLLDSTKRQTYDDEHECWVETNGICTVNITGGLIGPTDHTEMNGHVYGGGKGVGNDPTEYFKNYCNVHETRLTVSGGHISGSTFGGGADCHVLGHTHTTINFGAYIGSGEDVQEYDGCVWGGGRNALNINHTAGRVQGHTYVTVNGGHIRRTVQGGGALARTGVDTNGVVKAFCSGTAANGAPIYDSIHHGSTNIFVTGDTVLCDGELLATAKDYDGNTLKTPNTMTAEEKIKYKNFIYTLKNSGDKTLYGNYLGTHGVTDDGHIIIYKTAIGAYDGSVIVDNDYTTGDIFGGGKGDTKDTIDIMAGRVMNTYVTVTGRPRIMADIYAGGEMSSVGWWDTNLYQFKPDGTYEYSSSRPKNNLHDKYYGRTGYTHLDIKVVGNGECNPLTGTPFEYSSSNIHGGRAWTLIDSTGRLYHTCSGNVYGGGQGYVEQDGTHRENWVHMGRVRRTFVNVYGGRFMGNCFGGGSRGVIKEDCHVNIYGGRFGNIITDHITVTTTPYTYDVLSNTPLIVVPIPGTQKDEEFNDEYAFGSVFAGGYGNHKVFSHINDSSFVYPNGKRREMIPVMQAGRVYGNTHLKISGGQIMGNVYGGGDLASTGYVQRHPTTGNLYLHDSTKWSGGVCNVWICNDTTNGVITGPTIGPLHDEQKQLNGHVYGAGKGVPVDKRNFYKEFCNVNETHLLVTGGHIHGSTFGGGADCHVLGCTYTTIKLGAYIGSGGREHENGTYGDEKEYDGCVWGGGRNAENSNGTAGRVQGNTHIKVSGGRIRRTIQGGGALARTGVGVDGNIADANGFYFKLKTDNSKYDSINHGFTHIYVTGDTVKVEGLMHQSVYAYTEITGSHVVKAHDGVTDSTVYEYNDVYAPDSTCFKPEDAITYRDYIGTTRTTANKDSIVVYLTAIGAFNGAVLVDNDYTIGDIFGGGKGDTKDTLDILAGRVMNTDVHIQGSPRIMADIYAGGEMSSVGWWDTNLYQFKPDGTYEYSSSRPKNDNHDIYVDGTGYPTSSSMQTQKAYATPTPAPRMSSVRPVSTMAAPGRLSTSWAASTTPAPATSMAAARAMWSLSRINRHATATGSTWAVCAPPMSPSTVAALWATASAAARAAWSRKTAASPSTAAASALSFGISLQASPRPTTIMAPSSAAAMVTTRPSHTSTTPPSYYPTAPAVPCSPSNRPAASTATPTSKSTAATSWTASTAAAIWPPPAGWNAILSPATKSSTTPRRSTAASATSKSTATPSLDPSTTTATTPTSTAPAVAWTMTPTWRSRNTATSTRPTSISTSPPQVPLPRPLQSGNKPPMVAASGVPSLAAAPTATSSATSPPPSPAASLVRKASPPTMATSSAAAATTSTPTIPTAVCRAISAS